MFTTRSYKMRNWKTEKCMKETRNNYIFINVGNLFTCLRFYFQVPAVSEVVKKKKA